ncbi:hypothetical protein [Ferrovum sp.]|jgi:hypothetical protein|uniref:hypothetical protein n=1 Tax=Ferrovum sp. TaxID=2609467 RepID=UPI00262BD559|nr:hypothetical protein [Ferrovum sp.]MBW8067240.1 hypothetical protein [Ferrovum sp.]
MAELAQVTVDMYDVLHWIFLRTPDDMEQLLKPDETVGWLFGQSIDKTETVGAGN